MIAYMSRFGRSNHASSIQHSSNIMQIYADNRACQCWQTESVYRLLILKKYNRAFQEISKRYIDKMHLATRSNERTYTARVQLPVCCWLRTSVKIAQLEEQLIQLLVETWNKRSCRTICCLSRFGRSFNFGSTYAPVNIEDYCAP